MNDILAKVQDENTPKFNKKVTEGAAKEILRSSADFISSIITTTIAGMTHTGLEYHGWRRLTPKEEFNRLFRNNDKKTSYDMARSDLYMIELKFTYRGKAIPRELYLPYADIANIMKISDTAYNIVPVLSDTVISPSPTAVFVRLLKDKLTFSRFMRNYMVDGEKVLGQIIHSNTYRIAGRKIQDNLGTSSPSISMYILGDMGIREAYAKYAGITDIIITSANTEEYMSNYRVYESVKMKPKGHKEYNYVGHDLKIMIPRDKITDENEMFVDNFTYGIIYTLDLLPESANELLEILNNHDLVNEKLFWKLTLGRVLFRNGYSVDKMMGEMDDHFKSLHNYMDNLIKDKLRDVGVRVDTYFDLIAVILNNYNVWLLNSKEHNSNIDNRYIDILYYLLYDIVYGFNRALFDINKKCNKRELSINEVTTIMNNQISPRKIFGIVKSSATSLAVSLADYSGDNMWFKITSQIADQSQGNGVKKGKGTQFPESTKTLRAQDLWFGSLLYLGKSSPSPRFRLNPFMDYDLGTGKLKMDEEITKKVSYLDGLLKGKDPYNKLVADSELGVDVEEFKDL